ncbi:MAG: serine/threonine-protein kinase RsbW [Cellvibrionaceae bacterium]|jgi:serine/threonine-protein kinase RsbW
MLLDNFLPQKEGFMETTVIRLDLPAEHKHLNVIGACLNALLERIDRISDKEMLAYNLELALHETCTNIVEHAYFEREGRIQVAMSVIDFPQRQFVIDVHDTGAAFDLTKAEEPDLEGAQVHGYGLFLMRQLLDEVVYQSGEVSNHWHLVKNI